MVTSKTPRITGATLKVLGCLLDSYPNEISGAEIINQRKMLSGTIYPLLERLEVSGWVTSSWEQVDPREVGRPRKRLYKLTSAGLSASKSAVQEHSHLGSWSHSLIQGS